MESVTVSSIVVAVFAANCTMHLWHVRVRDAMTGTLIPIAAVSRNGDLMQCIVALNYSLVAVAVSVASVTALLSVARALDVTRSTLDAIVDH
jgi:hypothetical protein